MKRRLLSIVGVLALFAALPCLASKPSFELRDGDRVVFVGGVFMEREQEDSHIETMLTLAFPERKVSFRNLGWGGDTVESHLANPPSPARPKYVPSLFDYVATLKPTVIFVSYGMMESFAGEAGLRNFEKNYHAVLDKLSAQTSRVVLISPFRHEKIGGHFPDPTKHNQNLARYAEAIRNIADQRGFAFVNLFTDLNIDGRQQLTSNGVHLNSEGYKQAALVIRESLRLPKPSKAATRIARAIQPLIRTKNSNWWFHYRPMNSEYVYPGGTRYQNDLAGFKHPMFSEIEKFAELAIAGDEIIHAAKTGAESMATDVARPITPRDGNATPDPEAERKTFQVHEGFEVNLFAADPLISKPVQIAFDLKGRLWVATTTLYPQIQPGEMATDKVIILEDVDGDGRADKTTVFADGLHIPTGILPYRDGAFIGDDTTILFMRDTDGDGRADTREVVLSGFGTEDSHHKTHVLRWGPDGRFHFNVGVFLHNNIETAHGITSMSGYWQPGVIAYHPNTGKLEPYLANSVPPNPWGHYWNRWGFDFHIDSSGQQGSNFILPTSGRTSTAIPVPGGHGKLAGGEVMSGRHLPEDWQGNLIAAPFKENRVARWAFSDDSSGYALKAMSPIIVSTDPAFRPVDERMGPDGALYISDWYNPLIGHMQHHFRDPGRDFTHGRIWRVTAKGRPLVPRPKIAGASIKELLDHLKAPEDYTRMQAKRALAERDAGDVSRALSKWVKNLPTEDADYDHHRIEALWTYQTINVVEPALLKSLLRANDANARAAATAVLRDWHRKVESPLDILAVQVLDDSPRVRLQAIIALSYIPDARAMGIAVKALDKSTDHYIEEALKNTANALKPQWEPAFASGEPVFEDSKHLQFVLQHSPSAAGVKPLLKLLVENKIPANTREHVLNTIVSFGDADALAELFNASFDSSFQPKVLAGLARASQERKVVPNVKHNRLGAWLGGSDATLTAAALRLIGLWKAESFRADVEKLLTSHTPETTRNAAVETLANLGGGKTTETLRKMAGPQNSAAVRLTALNGLAKMDVNIGAAETAMLLQTPAGNLDVSRVLQIFLQRKEGAEALGKAIAQKRIHADNAKLALRALRVAGRQDETLVSALSEAAGLNAEPDELSREELQRLASDVQSKGDAVRGEKVFRQPDLSCFQCHAVNGAGGLLGPDLGAIGSGSQVDYLIESLLTPNKIIKDGFETVEVTTTDDDYVLGIRVKENKNELVLKDASRAHISLPKTKIKERQDKRVSLMPAGLTTGLTQGEFLDLCRFLSELGKPGLFANNPRPIIRRWAVSPALPSSNAEPQWTPVYSLVSGILPLEILSADGQRSSAMARCEFNVTTAGRIQFKLNSAAGVKLKVDGKPTKLTGNSIVLDLERGKHTLVFTLDLSARNEGLLLEIEDVPGSAGRFQILAGP